jgi:hypothetical protein
LNGVAWNTMRPPRVQVDGGPGGEVRLAFGDDQAVPGSAAGVTSAPAAPTGPLLERRRPDTKDQSGSS